MIGTQINFCINNTGTPLTLEHSIDLTLHEVTFKEIYNGECIDAVINMLTKTIFRVVEQKLKQPEIGEEIDNITHIKFNIAWEHNNLDEMVKRGIKLGEIEVLDAEYIGELMEGDPESLIKVMDVLLSGQSIFAIIINVLDHVKIMHEAGGTVDNLQAAMMGMLYEANLILNRTVYQMWKLFDGYMTDEIRQRLISNKFEESGLKDQVNDILKQALSAPDVQK